VKTTHKILGILWMAICGYFFATLVPAIYEARPHRLDTLAIFLFFVLLYLVGASTSIYLLIGTKRACAKQFPISISTAIVTTRLEGNRMKFRVLAMIGLACSLGLSSLVAHGADAPKLSNKWRIEVSGGANSDGTMLFRVTPDKGTPVDVTVPIKDGRGENNVAQDIKAMMKKTLDPKTYHVEVDDGEDVLVKKKWKSPNFALVLVESTVKGSKIRIKKE